MTVEALKTALADVVVFSTKAQFYHWNVEGFNFVEFHKFFGELYEEVHGSVDTLAELIRVTGSYAPGTLSRFLELTTIEESEIILDPRAMTDTLFRDNLKVIASLMKAHDIANNESEFGISNYLQDRIQAHEKHSWMLRSIIK